MPALADRKRSGWPPTFTALQIVEVEALACQLPVETDVPLSRWSCPELAAELTARGITDSLSASTVRRRLAQDALIPWQRRSWIFVTDAASCGSWGQGRVVRFTWAWAWAWAARRCLYSHHPRGKPSCSVRQSAEVRWLCWAVQGWRRAGWPRRRRAGFPAAGGLVGEVSVVGPQHGRVRW
ncbi:helix-turn-helix domain-containing protein [Streptomyces sp. NPDC007172]|uniref:helix-turn-helix domain-containing protein n=1 Tax=Streptomyces sp. NPDC007172 TaxID=3364776 RepID=UPI00367B63B2